MGPSSTKSKLVVGIVVLDLVLLNLGLGYLFYKSQIPIPKSQISTNVPMIQSVDQCGEDCRAYIDSKITQVQASPSSWPTPTPTPKPIVAPVSPKSKTRAVSYVTVPGSGSGTANDWTALSGTDFYFNTADYPGLVEVYFEANIKLFNGNGVAYVRLFDATHGIGVQGGEVQTSSQAAKIVESGRVTFWSGKNLIRVQAKSLTADTAIFDSGRLRIVTEKE